MGRGYISKEKEKVEKENQKENKKICWVKKPLKKGKKGSAERANRVTSERAQNTKPQHAITFECLTPLPAYRF